MRPLILSIIKVPGTDVILQVDSIHLKNHFQPQPPDGPIMTFVEGIAEAFEFVSSVNLGVVVEGSSADMMQGALSDTTTGGE